MKSVSLIVLALFGAIAVINAYPSVKGAPSYVSGSRVPPSPGNFDRPSKVNPARDGVKGVPVVQQQQQYQPQQVQDEIKGVQQRDPVKGRAPVVPQYPVKGVQQRDPVKGISQQPVKGQSPVVQQRKPYQPAKGYPQQAPQQFEDDYQQRQQPSYPVKGQRKTRSLNYEQVVEQTKLGPSPGAKGRKGGNKGVPKVPTKSLPRFKGAKAVDDVKIVQLDTKIEDIQAPVQVKELKHDEQVQVIQEPVPVVQVSQEKVAQQSVPVVTVVQEKVVQQSVKVPQESVKAVPELSKSVPEQVKETQFKAEDVQVKTDEEVKGQSIIYSAVARGGGINADAIASAQAIAQVVVPREPSPMDQIKKIGAAISKVVSEANTMNG